VARSGVIGAWGCRVAGVWTVCVESAMSALAPVGWLGRQTKIPFTLKDEKGIPWCHLA